VEEGEMSETLLQRHFRRSGVPNRADIVDDRDHHYHRITFFAALDDALNAGKTLE
jgi:hypothetical protein